VKWDLDDLVAISDLAEHFYVGKPTISNWTTRYPDFPRPLVVVARGNTPLFSRRAVIDWYERREWQHDGPGSKTGKR
jgi:hypothetical protein